MSIETETLQNQAKQLVKQGLKDRALLVIKLRKHKESFTATIDNQLLTVLKQIEDVEWAAINVDVFKAIKAGTDMLNKIHNEISIEEVEALMDETKEAIDVSFDNVNIFLVLCCFFRLRIKLVQSFLALEI